MVSLNSNFSQQNNFTFNIGLEGNKNILLNVTEISGLGMNISPTEVPFGGNRALLPGTTVQFNEMNLSVLLDDKLETLEQVYTYMNTLKDTSTDTANDQHTFQGLLRMFDGMYYPQVEYTFHNCWITSLGDITLSTTISEAEPIILSVGIQYDFFEFKRTA